MAQVLTQQKKRRGRPRLSDTLIQFRLPAKDAKMLIMITEFEGRDKAEIFRNLFLVLKRQYRKDRVFRRWAEKTRDKLKADHFIDVDEVLP